MKTNRWVSDQEENVIIEEHSDNYFSFIDREKDYVYTFNKNQIDSIVEFLESIR